MKYFSYVARSTRNIKAVSLKDVRAVIVDEGLGRSSVRYDVNIHYTDATVEAFCGLKADEAKEVYEEIVNLLNEA